MGDTVDTRVAVPEFTPNIERGLREGMKLRAWRSGGGLMVVRVEHDDHKEGISDGYGEHPYLKDAIEHAEVCMKKGGLTYEEMYNGENAMYTHYLTGTYDANTPIERAIHRGGYLRAKYVDGKYLAAIENWERENPGKPKEEMKKLEVGEYIEWESRGFKFRTTCKDTYGGSYSTEVLHKPNEDDDPFSWHSRRVGEGSTLFEAAANAIVAERVEYSKESEKW